MSPRPFHEEDDSAKTVNQQRFDSSLEADVSFLFQVIEGVDAGKSLRIDATLPQAFIGKSQAAELCLADPSVSRRHASLTLAGGAIRIKDEGSTNGTWVNGVSVVEANLVSDAQLRIGGNLISATKEATATTEILPTRTSFHRVLGGSREMRRLYALVERIAASTIPTVIEGETGTGKEALAEAIHESGPRAGGPFVVFDCTAVPASMVEAELFGHERGAFTGAVQRHVGLMEQANGGTLLIDEIGDLDLPLQPKLLRAIERGEFRRIGGATAIRVDVRILAATRRNLELEVEAGRFRDDLFHRLAVGRVFLPALRHRRGDVSLLAHALVRQLGGAEAAIPPDILVRWEQQAWPGNVRELRNAVARYLALGQTGMVAAPVSEPARERRAPEPSESGSVSETVERVLQRGGPLAVARQEVIDAFESVYLATILARHGGVVTRAAEAAGIARRHFQRLRARGRG